MLSNLSEYPLRYQLQLQSVRPDDALRKFVMSYQLSDDTISIYENPQRNSGIISGKFLQSTRVTKPGSTTDDPAFYAPSNFAIGSVIEIFRHRFKIVDADDHVKNYLDALEKSQPGSIPESTIASMNK